MFHHHHHHACGWLVLELLASALAAATTTVGIWFIRVFCVAFELLLALFNAATEDVRTLLVVIAVEWWCEECKCDVVGGFTAENCLSTWDSDELAVWWWKICCGCCTEFVALTDDEVIDGCLLMQPILWRLIVVAPMFVTKPILTTQVNDLK